MSDKISTATHWEAISPSTSIIEPIPQALWVDVAGSITVEGSDGNTEVFEVAAGTVLPLQPVRLTAATASGIKALYN